MIFLLYNFIFIFLLSFVDCQLLDCNFDQQNFCRWTNAVNGAEDDFDWRIDNSAPIDGFHSIPRTVTGTGFFAYAQGRFRPTETEAARAWLLTPVINGLSNPATMNFVFWKTAAPPVLQTCIRDSGSNVPRCLDTISGLGQPSWVQRTVTIPSSSLPFQIVLVASGFRTGLDLIGVDDITVRYASGETLGQIGPGGGSGALTAYQQPSVPGPFPPGGQYPQPFPGPLAPSSNTPGFYAQPAPGAPLPIPGAPVPIPGALGPIPGAPGPLPGVPGPLPGAPAPLPSAPGPHVGASGPVVPPPPPGPGGVFPPPPIGPTPSINTQQIVAPNQLPQPNYQIPGVPPSPIVGPPIVVPPPPVVGPPIGVPRPQEPYVFITQPPFINTLFPITQPPFINTQPPFINTQPPFINTQPPFINTQPPFINTQPPFINTVPPFINTQPPLINTQPPFINTQPPFINTPQIGYVNPVGQVSLPNPRPLFPNQQFPQQIERNTFQPQQPPNPIDRNPPLTNPNQIVQTVHPGSLIERQQPQPPINPDRNPPLTNPNQIVQTVHPGSQIERNPTGTNPVIINPPPPLNPQYYVTNISPNGVATTDERLIISHYFQTTVPLETTTHDHRFYMTTVKEEEKQSGHQTSPRLAVKLDSAEASSGQCSAVACPFNKDFCKWYNDLSSNFDWKLKYAPVPYQGAGYIFVNGDYRKFEQRASIKTPSFVVPQDSVLEFLAFISDADSGRLGVYIDDSGNPTNLLWKAVGHKNLGGTGWRRIRVPLPPSSFPTTLSLVSDQLLLGQFIGLDDVRLTDKSGFDIGCASDSAFPETTATPRPVPVLQQSPVSSPDGNVAKINEAPIKESAVFSQSRTPLIFVDPTTKQISSKVPNGRQQQGITKFENNDENSPLNNQVEIYNDNNNNGPLKKDQIIENDAATIRDSDLFALNFTRKKHSKNTTNNAAQEFLYQDGIKKENSGENVKRKKNGTQSLPSFKTTPNPDPLGLKEFVLQISRDLRDLIAQPAGRFNINNLYNNYPIF